ncbi:zinc finger protein PLAGL2 [Myxocyprinus asiaticus]|nr:zinc finger protein PLAGL2 [Myxocyprinus asiaticus]XP_051515424.1 zinc finger protein PLAGL2 [Myxocyprinus asiaticus]XP_051515425.1 zinc finger protein PLAGL2 [Myxocyprinus asiaticus]XP_051515426.1 zinc finger protein PLAGL2 [Myxocyprinus asiaticus]XP_051515428.1 zinc finger protein PLAGL2 [Myxocyprinus asiaticus]XP_051515429.1 zinc finger protein PLAGL2 [Myxocyprinus asiaticus]
MAAAAADAPHHIDTLTLEDEERRAATKLLGGPAAGRTEREIENEREREREGRGSGNECLVCGALFSSQDKLRLHSFCHAGEKSFHCSQPHCPKAFSSKYKLFRHMATHSPQKTHQCSFCEKMFHRKDHLKNHLQTHDPNKEAFKCEECGKHYNTKLGYKRHMAIHSATAGDLTCKVCLQSYESTPALLEHLKSHSGKSSGGAKEKKHPCDHCDRRFYTRKDVRRHMVVHTGRKDFLCQYCAQRFGRKDHLTRHVKKSHSQELLKVKTEPPDMLGLLGSGSTCAVKEEISPMMCSMGPTKDSMMAKTFPGATPFPMGMYNPHHLQAMSSPSVGHHHSLVPGSLSTAIGMGCHMETPSSLHHHHPHHHHHHPHHHHHSPPPHHHQQQPSLPNQQQQHPQPPPKYQLGSTSYLLEKPLKVEMESFLMDLQSGLPVPPLPSVDPHSATSPNKEGLEPPPGLSDDLCGDLLMSKSPAFIAESFCAANMDFSHLLGFLPLNLPPYSTPMSSGGLVMGYSTSSTVSSTSSSSSASSHAAEPLAATTTAVVPLTSLQPQPQEQPGSSGGLGLGPLHPLPPVFSSSLSTTTLPRFHQAFQ